MNSSKVKELVLASVFCAMIYTMTWIAIPAPTIGNINLGDCMIILCAFIMGGKYAILTAAVGSTLCDITSGYIIYAPGTFFIKALMALVILLARKFIVKSGKNTSLVVLGALAEIIMIIGYFIYEALFLGYGAGAIINVPFNAVQGTVNLVVAVLLFTLLNKSGAIKTLFNR